MLLLLIILTRLSLEKEDIRNIFKLKKELNYRAIKDIRNLFRLEKQTDTIIDRILRDIWNLFEDEEEEEISKSK